jgi:ribonucleotide reductase alpha subunit
MLKNKKIKSKKRIFDLLNVGKFNNFVSNGAVVHNCSEIFLYSSETMTYTCCLSSQNLVNWDSISDEDIFDSIVFLDCVNSEFILQSKDIPGLEKARRFAEWSRPVGLGVMGFSSYLQSKNIPFDSMEAHLLNTQIFKRIREVSDKANVWLAEIYLVSNGVIEPPKELTAVMANTIMGELLAKGLTSHEDMIEKFKAGGAV